MKTVKIIAVLSLLTSTISCGGIGGRVYDQELISDIGLLATDRLEEMKLLDFSGEKGVLVPSTVFAVGWNESHVIVKRHPPSSLGQLNDKSQTEYFIVEVKRKIVHGPYDRDFFNWQRDKMGLAKKLDFSLIFSHIE